MTAIYGARSTENVLQANRLYDIAPEIYNRYPIEAPFLTLTRELSKKQTIDPEFKWFGKAPRADADAINYAAGYAAGDTLLTVDNANRFVPGDLLRVIDESDGSYGEVIRVTGVNTGTNVITVQRGVGSTAAAALADNDILLNIGDAHDEGSSSPDGVSELATERKNYTQIFKTSTEYTRTLKETRLRVDPDEVTRRRKEKSREHMRKIEKAMLWGERGISGDGSDAPNRKTGGIYYWIQDCISVDGINNTQSQSGGTMTEIQWETFLETMAFAYGSEEKLLIASPRLISVVNNLVRGRIEVANKSKEYGIDLLNWTSPHGHLKILRHKLFSRGIFQYAGLVVDMSQLRLRYVGDSDQRFQTDIGDNDKDSNKDQWLSEVGLEVGDPSTMALITNVQTAA